MDSTPIEEIIKEEGRALITIMVSSSRELDQITVGQKLAVWGKKLAEQKYSATKIAAIAE